MAFKLAKNKGVVTCPPPHPPACICGKGPMLRAMAYAYVFCEPHVSVIKGTVSGVTCTEPRNGGTVAPDLIGLKVVLLNRL